MRALENWLGPSSKVMAYLLDSWQPRTSAVLWHGPQSAGQFPHVCHTQTHRQHMVQASRLQQVDKGVDHTLRITTQCCAAQAPHA